MKNTSHFALVFFIGITVQPLCFLPGRAFIGFDKHPKLCVKARKISIFSKNGGLSRNGIDG